MEIYKCQSNFLKGYEAGKPKVADNDTTWMFVACVSLSFKTHKNEMLFS